MMQRAGWTRTATFVVLMATASATAATRDDVTGAFAAYKQEFTTRATQALGAESVALWDRVSLLVSKRLIARTAVKAINSSKVSIEVTYPKQRIPGPPDGVPLRTAKLDVWNCSADRWGCNSDCKWYDLGCVSAKAACEVNKQANQKICEVQKAAREAISDKLILTVFIDTAIVEGRLNAGAIALDLDDQLNAFQLRSATTGSALVSGDGYFKIEPVFAVLFLCADHIARIEREPIEIKESGLIISGVASVAQLPDGALVTAQLNKPHVTLHFAGNPVLRAIANNPANVIKCPIPYTLGAVADLFFPNDFAKLDVDLDVPTPQLRVAEVHLKVGSGQLKLSPVVGPLAIGVSAAMEEPGQNAN